MQMLLLACMRHWYESMIFFGPVPIAGLWVWLSGRRHLEEDPQEERSSSAPPRPLA